MTPALIAGRLVWPLIVLLWPLCIVYVPAWNSSLWWWLLWFTFGSGPQFLELGSWDISSWKKDGWNQSESSVCQKWKTNCMPTHVQHLVPSHEAWNVLTSFRATFITSSFAILGIGENLGCVVISFDIISWHPMSNQACPHWWDTRHGKKTFQWPWSTLSAVLLYLLRRNFVEPNGWTAWWLLLPSWVGC